jgi:hypothetical protein
MPVRAGWMPLPVGVFVTRHLLPAGPAALCGVVCAPSLCRGLCCVCAPPVGLPSFNPGLTATLD